MTATDHAPSPNPPATAATPAWRSRRFLALAACAGIFLVLAWTRALDHLTLAYLDDALLGSGAIYATARSINALVSVLQGTEIDVVFVSFTIGEMLDPVNDLIERFSGLVLLALGSLALQQLLITIMTHGGVNAALTVAALAALLLWLFSDVRRQRQLFYFLCLLALVRLALPVVALTTHWVDRAFLAEAEQAHYESMRQFQAQLEQAGKEAGIAPESSEEMARLREAQAQVNASRLDAETRIATLEVELADARTRLAALPRPPLWKPWEPEPPEVAEVRREIDVIEGQLDLRREVASELGKEAAVLRDQLECLQRRSEGRECSFAEGAVQFVRKADIRPQLVAISERVEAFAGALIRLLTSMLFRSVLLPVATLWLSVRLTLWVIRRLAP